MEKSQIAKQQLDFLNNRDNISIMNAKQWENKDKIGYLQCYVGDDFKIEADPCFVEGDFNIRKFIADTDPVNSQCSPTSDFVTAQYYYYRILWRGNKTIWHIRTTAVIFQTYDYSQFPSNQIQTDFSEN